MPCCCLEVTKVTSRLLRLCACVHVCVSTSAGLSCSDWAAGCVAAVCCLHTDCRIISQVLHAQVTGIVPVTVEGCNPHTHQRSSPGTDDVRAHCMCRRACVCTPHLKAATSPPLPECYPAEISFWSGRAAICCPTVGLFLKQTSDREGRLACRKTHSTGK